MSKGTRCKDCRKSMTTVHEYYDDGTRGDVLAESICDVCIDGCLPTE